MARKRSVFFGHIRSVLRSVLIVGAFCLGLYLSVATAQVAVAQNDSPLASAEQPTEQVEQAQQLYEAGRYQQSVDYLNQAVTAFSTPDTQLQRAIALSNLSLAYQALREWDSAENSIQESLRLIGFDSSSDALKPDHDERSLQILAPTLEVYAQLWQSQGEAAKALELWQQSVNIYSQLNQPQQQLNAQLNQLQALQFLGLDLQATDLAETLSTTLQILPDSALKVRGLRHFGEALRSIGALNASEQQLMAALTIAQQLPAEPEITDTDDHLEMSELFLSLGNTYRALGDREKERLTTSDRQGISPWQCQPTLAPLPDQSQTAYTQAEQFYLKSIELAKAPSTSPSILLSAQLNRLSTRLAANQTSAETQQLWNITNSLLQASPPERSIVYAHINLAKQGSCLNQLNNRETIPWSTLDRELKTAVQTADSLSDIPAKSYALGYSGGLYELLARLEDNAEPQHIETWQASAEALTEQALLLTQAATYPDIAYQWSWQLARLKMAQGETSSAIEFYRQTVHTLEAIRGNLLTVDSDAQFSFRDNVEPVYRELADILLRPETPDDNSLVEAVQLIDTLQLSELENFLRCNLEGTFELSETETDATTAVFYTVILSDRLEVIVQLPGGQLEHHRVFKPAAELTSELDKLASNLQKTALSDETDRLSRSLYQWLIEPAAASLTAQSINTLVFVLDGNLRNVPISALQTVAYDPDLGESPHYLIQDYAIALAPRLQLQNPQPIDTANQKALVFGLSKISEDFQADFSPLSGVDQEAENIQTQLPARLILNEDFTAKNLAQALQETSFSIIHFATHGEFSSDPENTYILAWDSQVKSNQLRDLIRQRIQQDPIDLLILSACKTADGDNRATLGIAGLSLQAGAESTIASLWVVDDQATVQFMDIFYRILNDSNNSVGRAEALRQTQLTLIAEGRYQVPTYWAPFILVGNWL